VLDRFSQEEQLILLERARHIGTQALDTQAAQRRSLLTIIAGGEPYAVYLDDLLAIHDSVPVTPVPGTPRFVRGIANVRGHILPVVDLAVMLTGDSGRVAEGKLLLLEIAQEQVALLVDETQEIVSQDVNQIEALPAEMDHLTYATGILPNGVVLLDILAQLKDPRLLVNEITDND